MDPLNLLFMCPYNAAKSVLAAAYARRLAAARGLPWRVGSAGTEPVPAPTPGVVAYLREQGIDVAGHRPRRVTAGDLAAADLIIAMGCDLSGLAPPGATILNWDDVPPPSQGIAAAARVIRAHIDTLALDDS